MKKLFKCYLMLLTLILANNIYAQDRTITGTVASPEDGQPLNGVSVVVVGTKIGTTTGADGRFSIRVPSGRTQLEFAHVGFVTNRVSLTGGNNLNVVLSQDVRQLTDVVVVGYGSQRKSDITGAISSIKGSDLQQLSTQRVDQALQGRAAGVMVLNTDGAPGGNTTIRIRGSNSITGGNNALIVIDGLQGANLNSLNPNDIESIEILKDASATAIYGAQGANGVVLITTRLGKTGKPVIAYNYSYGVSKLRKKLDVMNAADFARTVNAVAMTRNGSGAIPVPIFTDADIQKYQSTTTDWQDVIYRTAPIQNHELSMSGGTDNLKYLVSGGFLNQQGILVNSEYQRYSLRANLRAEVTKWSSFGLSWSGIKEAGNSPPFGSADGSFLGNPVNVGPRWAPTEPVYDANGNYSVHRKGYGASDTWNPLASALEPDINNNTITNLLNAYLEFRPLAGLSIRLTGGASIINGNNRHYHNQKTYEGRQSTGLGINTENTNARYQNSNIVTYDKTFGNHHLTVTGVAEQQFTRFNFSSVRASNFLVDQTGISNLGGASIIVPSSDASERVLNSFLGRINYSFADKYLLTASYRADGSSVFGKNNKWGYFPSGSVAWKASEESFVKNLNVFHALKFRASWGITGNQAISPYRTLANISSGGNYPYNGGEGTDLGFFVARAPNPNLKWESTEQTDIGVDMAFFKGRLTVTADYYKKKTTDLLLNRTIPGNTGFTTIIDNVGSVQNKGLELEISGDPLVGKVRWNTGFNISGNRNKVLDLGGVNNIGYNTTKGGYSVNNPFMYLIVGQSFGQIWGYGYEGTWKTGEAKEAAAFGQLPGDQRFTDHNGDGLINNKDLKVIGQTLPDFIYGWNNRISYGGFELNVLIQGTRGNDLFNMGRIRMENPGEGTSTALLNRWTPENQNTNVPAFIDQKTREQANLVSKINITGDERRGRWVEDGSYIRLKNINLYYSIPKSVTNRFHMNMVRAFIGATNLITITKYTGYDPEVSSYNGNDAQVGVDFSNYPQAKLFNAGLNISF